MGAGTGTTVDCQRRLSDAYAAKLAIRQLRGSLRLSSEPSTFAVDPRPWLDIHRGHPFIEGLKHRVASDGENRFQHWWCEEVHREIPSAFPVAEVYVGGFLDNYFTAECHDPDQPEKCRLVFVSLLAGGPEGTEHFVPPAISEPVEPPVDWDRWHELRDIMDKRGLTHSEEAEYQRFVRIVARLDAEAARAADVGLDGLVKEHESVIASIRRLTAAVRAAAEQR